MNNLKRVGNYALTEEEVNRGSYDPLKNKTNTLKRFFKNKKQKTDHSSETLLTRFANINTDNKKGGDKNL